MTTHSSNGRILKKATMSLPADTARFQDLAWSETGDTRNRTHTTLVESSDFTSS